MKRLSGYALTILILTLIPQRSYAATQSLPISTQVKQVSQWFTGLFNNQQQVERDPSVPLISLSTCPVSLSSSPSTDNTENLYLEQQSTVFNRIRFYSFSATDTAVQLSVRSFLNPGLLSGICDRPHRDRLIDPNNIATTSCNLNLTLEPSGYVGDNAPAGCPSSFQGQPITVVSSVSIQKNEIDSLDKIFTANGQLIASTPIEFRRTTSVPEPSPVVGLLGLGIAGIRKPSIRKSSSHRNHPLT
jgi:hypothetical protein